MPWAGKQGLPLWAARLGPSLGRYIKGPPRGTCASRILEAPEPLVEKVFGVARSLRGAFSGGLGAANVGAQARNPVPRRLAKTPSPGTLADFWDPMDPTGVQKSDSPGGEG